MGISRRELTLLGLTGITATGGGYWHLRTPKTVLEGRSVDQLEQDSFTLDSKSYIQERTFNSKTLDNYVLYDADSLEIMRENGSINEYVRNVLPAGTYNVSAVNALPEIKAAPVYYLRDTQSGSGLSLETLTNENADESRYLLRSMTYRFEYLNETEDEVLINPPGGLITYSYPEFDVEYYLRTTKQVLDPVVKKADKRIKQRYQDVWKEYHRLMAAGKTILYLNRLDVDDYLLSNIGNNLTNIPTINSANYAFNFTNEDIGLGFYAKKATVHDNQATVPVGLLVGLDSDLPFVDKDTGIYTNTFDVPAILTPKETNTKYLDNSIYNLSYRQWKVDYEDIRSNILNLVQDSIDSL